MVAAAVDQGPPCLARCISALPGGHSAALAEAVIGAGLARNNSPPAPVKAAPPRASATSPTTYKAPPPGFAKAPPPSRQASAPAVAPSTAPAIRSSAATFLGPEPTSPRSSATPEVDLTSTDGQWPSQEAHREANRAGCFSAVAWQVKSQGWTDEAEMRLGLSAGFVDGESYRAHIAGPSPKPESVFPPARPAIADTPASTAAAGRSASFPYGVPSSKPALQLDPSARMRLRISLGKGNRRAHLDEDQVDPDLRPLLVADSSVIDEYEKRQSEQGQFQAPLPWARGAAYLVIRRHIADRDGRRIPRIPVTVDPCLQVGWCGHPCPVCRTRRCLRPVFNGDRGEHPEHVCQRCHDETGGRRQY